MLAIENQRPEIVDLLLAHPKTEINGTDYEGNTAIDIAIIKKNVDILKKLLARRDIELSKISSKPEGEMHELIKARAIELGQQLPEYSQ